MTSVCVECRNSKHFGESATHTRGCPCPVHASCWLDRVQKCIEARVAWIRCAKCWSIVWVPKHKMEQDDGADERQPMKRQRM